MTRSAPERGILDSSVPGRTDERRASNGRALVLHPDIKTGEALSRTPEARLEEAVGLAEAIQLEIVEAESPRLYQFPDRFHLGRLGDIVVRRNWLLCLFGRGLLIL